MDSPHDPKSPPLPLAETTRALLRRLLDGDPLDLAGRSARQLQERALLLDPRRAHLRAAARIARAASSAPGQELETWIASEIERALDELVEEQADEERRGDAPADSCDFAYHARIALRLGLPPQLARRACVVLNRLSREARRVYVGVELEGRSLSDLGVELEASPHAVGRLLREVQRSLLRVRESRDLSRAAPWSARGRR
jgi:hypothetical protein